MMMISLVTLLMSLTLAVADLADADCPTENVNVAFSESLGCVWADKEEDNRFDNYDAALSRCKTLMGDEGQLIEILSEEDQELAVALMKATEATFSIETAQAYWWSGLKDEDDDGQWVWAGSQTPAVYTNWADGSAPDAEGINCMQFVSGSDMEEAGLRGVWSTFDCSNNYINTHALCQLKGVSGPTTASPTTTTTVPTTTTAAPTTTTEAPTTTTAAPTTTTAAPTTTTAAPTTTTAAPTTPTTTSAPTTTTTTITTTATTTTAAPTTTTTEAPVTTTTAPSSGGLVSIYFVTGSCIGCETGIVEDGLKVTLLSLEGSGCVTESLDDPSKVDYFQGQEARFSSQEVGLAGCSGATLEGGPIGGSVMWTGTGIFAARFREICMELDNGEYKEQWCCEMAESASSTNQAVLLEYCGQV